MTAKYSIKVAPVDAFGSEAWHAIDETQSRNYRSLESARKRAQRACRAYDTSAQIYNEQGSLVLRVDANGWRAP